MHSGGSTRDGGGMDERNGPPPLQGISHIALSVDDLPAAMAFWTRSMGFEATTDTPSLGFLVHRGLRIALGLTDHGAQVRGPFDHRRCGLDHLALAVPDATALAAWRERLVRHGVACSPVTDSGSGHHVNLVAPGGVPLELYAMDAATAAAFGLDGPEQAHAGSAGAEPAALAVG